MSVVLPPYPDVETAVMDLVADLGDTGTETDSDLQNHLPFFKVARFGGTDDGITDRSAIAVDTYCSTRAEAMALSQTVHQRLTCGPNVVETDAGTVILDKAVPLTGPFRVPEGNTALRHFAATYRISARR